MDKYVTDGLTHRWVVASGSIAVQGERNELAQRVGSLRMKGHHPLGVRLADGDTQAWVTIRIGVQAVESEPCDLTAAGATPAKEQQCSPLVGVVQVLDGHHQPVQLGARDETWQP